MAVSVDAMEALLEHRFPEGTVTIEPWENFLLSDVMGIEPLPDGLAHPAFLFHLPLAGVGVSIAELLRLGRAESEEAVRAGEYRWELHQPLRVGVRYRVTGAFVDVKRRQTRRAGLLDAVTFKMEVSDDVGGAPVATTFTTVLFLRSS